ncbi:MAG: secretin N-terminal domain-containing protein [Kiritimatiellae bacterium]|jgi:general secretion pathway protein D|nr:secretin N-terminal domain-containing protein [Kiritimatiellia bacterium]
MNNICNHLMNLGAVSVLVLGVALAQDQTPQPAAVPVPAQNRPTPVTRRPLNPVRRPTAPGAAATPPAAPASSEPLEPTLDKSMLKNKSTMPGLKYKKNPIEIVLMDYALVTGKTLLTSPGVQPLLKNEITLESQEGVPLTREEYLDAIESVLSMNGIVLEPFGEKFLKVLPLKTVRTDGIRIQMDTPDGGYPEKSQVVSQMIQLKAIAVSEAQKAIEGFKRPDGLIQTFERTNSLLVTDTQENVNRMLEIIKFIDQPLVATEEVHVRVIRFAKADEIKKRLEEIVAESQKQSQAKEEIKANTSGSPGFTRTAGATSPLTGRPLPPGLSRLTAAAQQQQAASSPNEILETLVSDADRGMIRGKVQIISDERSNQLIIITRKENMNFFERIINVLDVETAPDVKVEVQRLEFADAEEVSTMLNDLIGNASSKKDDAAPTAAAKSDAPSRSTTLAEAAAARTRRSSSAASGAGDSGAAKLGQLSKDNIKILADKRTNAIVMMGSPSDLAAIKEIIKNMDIQLSQVLIETVVLEVGLNNKVETGIDWVKRVKPTTEERSVLTGYDETSGAPIYQIQTVERESSYRYGAGGGGGGSKAAQNLFALAKDEAGNVVDAVTSGGAGLEYMATFKNLRLDAIIKAAKIDDNTKVLSSPVLLTVDNKEATIEATDLKYMYKGMRYMGYSSTVSGAGSYEPDIEQRDVGLTVKVTPRISPNGNVILTIEETFENVVEPGQKIQDQYWPTITTRKLSADVSVGSGETVILGGLVKNSKGYSTSGIPILKDIPYIGKYLFGSTSQTESRSEMLVFLTPYVIDSAADMDREARRRKDYINATDIWTKGWSDSKLADPVPAAEMKKRLERKKEIEAAWRQYRESLETHHAIDGAIIDERTQTEALINASASANFAKEQAAHAAATNAPIGTLRVSETVEVLGPRDASNEALLKDADGTSPAAPAKASEQKDEAWWKFW